jgi:hypothetical protein
MPPLSAVEREKLEKLSETVYKDRFVGGLSGHSSGGLFGDPNLLNLLKYLGYVDESATFEVSAFSLSRYSPTSLVELSLL